jgi:HEAT repeat protein
MENASPLDEKLQILKRIEDIGNRDFDGVDVTKLLRGYLHSSDAEIILSALQAASNYAADEALFQDVFKMAHDFPDEEVRAMANSCLGAVIQDGLEFEETLPQGFPTGYAQVSRDFYREVRDFLLEKVDAPMESMEVRRRALEALGYLAFQPEVRSIVMRFYHQAPNPYVKVSALYAMGLVKDAVFERLILEELYSASEPVLLEAIHSAACLELHAAEERLLALSKSSSTDVRYEAVLALGAVAPLPRLPTILKALEAAEQNDEVREAIQAAKATLQQRSAMKQGDPIWDDNRILSEIEDILENREAGEGGDLPGKDGE